MARKANEQEFMGKVWVTLKDSGMLLKYCGGNLHNCVFFCTINKMNEVVLLFARFSENYKFKIFVCAAPENIDK